MRERNRSNRVKNDRNKGRNSKTHGTNNDRKNSGKKIRARVLGRRQLVQLIHKRLGGAIKQKDIAESIRIILAELTSALERDEIITIGNFGTFSTCLVDDRVGIDIASKEVIVYRARKSVKFRPSAVFIKLMKELREKFAQKLGKSRKKVASKKNA